MVKKAFFRRDAKSFLINPRFQWAMIRRALLLAAFNFLVFWGTVQYAYWAFADKARELNIEPGNVYFVILAHQKETMNILFLVAGALNVAVILLVGLMFSHRVAGPLFRLRQHLDDMAATGAVKPVQFRKKDYFSEVADSFNRAIKPPRP